MRLAQTIQHFATTNGRVHVRLFLDGQQVGSAIYTRAQWDAICAHGLDSHVIEPHPIAARQAAKA